MPRRKKEREPEQEPLPEMEEFTSEETEGTSRAGRLSLPLTPDGKSIDFASMQERTQEKYRTILGLPPGANRFEPPPRIEPGEVGYLYDALGTIEAWVAYRFFGVEEKLANLAFRYSEGEKAILAEPTAAVLNKYGAAMTRYKDEATLVMLLYAIHSKKIQWIREESQRLVKVELERERDRGARTEFQA